MATTVMDELVTMIGFKVKPNTQATINKFNHGIKDISRLAIGATAAIAAATMGIFWFINRNSDAAAAMYRFHEATGISIKTLQQWVYAARQAGGSVDSMKNDFLVLLDALSPFMPGQINTAIATLLGYDYQTKYKGDIEKLALDLNKLLSTMSEGDAIAALKNVGLSMENILMWTKNPQDLSKILKGAPKGPDKDEQKRAEEFRKTFDRIKMEIEYTAQKIALKFAPVLIRLMTQFDNWINKGNNLNNVLKAVGNVASIIGIAANKLWQDMQPLLDGLIKVVPPLKGLTDTMNKKVSGEALATAIKAIGIALLAIVNPQLAGAVAFLEILRQLFTMQPGQGGFFGWLADVLDGVTTRLVAIVQFFKDITSGRGIAFALKNFSESAISTTPPSYFPPTKGTSVTGVAPQTPESDVNFRRNMPLMTQPVNKIQVNILPSAGIPLTANTAISGW